MELCQSARYNININTVVLTRWQASKGSSSSGECVIPRMYYFLRPN